jgi:phage shock protein PspC (stress-responsive transcriptional regulator)
MTETQGTQGPSTTDEQQSSGTGGQQPGVDRQHLRNYEELRRSVTDRKVAGVAGGLGRHLNIDPTILRVLFVVLCFFGGAGFVLYGAAWVLVPEDGQNEGNIAMRPSTRNAVLIGAGVIAALLLVGDSWHGIGFPWPLLIVGVGALVYLAVRDKSSASEQTGAPVAPSAQTYGQQVPPPPWMPPTQTAPAYPPRRQKRGPKLFGFTLAMVALALGSLGLYDASGNHVVDAAYPALALTVVGVMLVVGAFIGRAGGLIFLGIVSAIALAGTSIAGDVDNIGRDRQDLNVTPTSSVTVKDDYFIPSGRVVLDLSEVDDPAALAGRSIDVGARVGELVVVLPDGLVTDVTADVSGPGEIDLPDRSSGGIDNTLHETYGSGAGELSINAHLFAGHIEVRNP